MTKRIITLLLLFAATLTLEAQKLIEYTSGMGSRDPNRSEVWILYQNVVATHEGMTLRADSAHYNTEENSFTAFRNIHITLTDTTFIYGDRLYYDGNTRVLDIWADTVVLIDGGTLLKANHLTYERNRSTAYYTLWGHATSDDRHVDTHGLLPLPFSTSPPSRTMDPWVLYLSSSPFSSRPATPRSVQNITSTAELNL